MSALILKTKYLRRRAHLPDWDRPRPKTCFAVFGIAPPFTAQSFALARQAWIALARDYRQSGATESEKVANIAWQHLKLWCCPVCGGLKKRTRAKTCGTACGDKLRHLTRLGRLGPVILRLGGSRYRGHALRRAQLTTLRNALVKSNHHLGQTARELGMSYGTLKHYIRKFGGYVDGKRVKPL